jgi:epoxyqueuosine reductase
MTSSSGAISRVALAKECERLGVECLGTVELVNNQGGLADWYAEHSLRLTQWLNKGAHAEMEWMERQVDKRCDPRLLLPEVKSAVTLWISHHFSSKDLPQEIEAKVARYAWGRDYHNVLRRVLRQLGKWSKQKDPTVLFHGSVDTSPVLERAIAQRCGIGWIGRSTMLIHPTNGTFGSLAILLTSAEFKDDKSVPHPDRCGTCHDCVQACPTNALGPEGLDARKCISYWTIEHRGIIPKHIRPLIGDWVFGCDICQEVCPWTMKAERKQMPASTELWQPSYERARPNLITWLSTSDDDMIKALQGSPLKRAFPHGLKRNAIIVLVNQKRTDTISIILDQFKHSHQAVRATAAWGVAELCTQQENEVIKSQSRDAMERLLNFEESQVVITELKDAIDRLSSALLNQR